MKKINSILHIVAGFRGFSKLLLIAALLMSSCEKDYIVTKKVDLSVPVSFSKAILPILTPNCAKSGCHVSGGQSPDLTFADAYDQLLGLGYVDSTNAEGSVLYSRITSVAKPMPPSGQLPANDISLILAWIKQGAQNN